jgi:hypothetical protein
VLDHLRCVKNISPGSIVHRIGTNDKKIDAGDSAVKEVTQLLIEPLYRNIDQWPIALSLCNPPGAGVGESEVRRQKEIEQRAQRPMIPALLAGKLPNSEYLDTLEGDKDAYHPINKQLWADCCR